MCPLDVKYKSFHGGMYAGVWVGTDVSDKFEVRNGLRQGCTMAPILYFNLTILWWPDGETFLRVLELYIGLHKHGRRLVRDRTRLERVQVTESQFADDLVLYTAFESVGQSFIMGAS